MVKYLLSVISAAVICSVAMNIFEKNSTFRTMGRLLSGIFLTITVISPLFKLELPNINEYRDILEGYQESIIAEGEDFYQKERREIIIQRTEAYILDKAVALGAEVEVTVRLSDVDPPIPEFVELSGTASPYIRSAMETMIAQDLGIPKERQIWK